jgi:hypothetical protein
MRQVIVVLTGQDKEKHEYRMNASSLYDAAEQAIGLAARYWWFDPMRLIEVRSGEEKWWVDPENLRKRRKR